MRRSRGDLRAVPGYGSNHFLGVYVPGVDEAADIPEATGTTETITFE